MHTRYDGTFSSSIVAESPSPNKGNSIIHLLQPLCTSKAFYILVSIKAGRIDSLFELQFPESFFWLSYFAISTTPVFFQKEHLNIFIYVPCLYWSLQTGTWNPSCFFSAITPSSVLSVKGRMTRSPHDETHNQLSSTLLIIDIRVLS